MHWIDRTGKSKAHYRKIHLTDLERPTFTPGEELTIVDTPWGKVGSMNCWDMVFIPCTHKGLEEVITWEDVEPYVDRMGPGRIVLFYTGWTKHAGTDIYFKHPYLDVNMIQRLLELGVRTIGIDAINIDHTASRKFPVHEAIVSKGGIIAENLHGLDAVDFPNPWISMLPMKLKGLDGAPVRAVAIQWSSSTYGI
jgi:kynurenine formamidase